MESSIRPETWSINKLWNYCVSNRLPFSSVDKKTLVEVVLFDLD